MRTRSSAKDNANQGPESSLSPSTAETSKEAPPKAAKPRGRAQDKPGAPPARKKSPKSTARSKSSSVENVGSDTGDATPPAALQHRVEPAAKPAGGPTGGAAAEEPFLEGSKVPAKPAQAPKGGKRSKAKDDPPDSVTEARGGLVDSVVLHHSSGKASEHVTVISTDASLQIQGFCPEILVDAIQGPALITRVANAISFCAGVAEDFGSSPIGVYATGDAVVLALQAFGNLGLVSYPTDVPQLLAVAPKIRDVQLIKFSDSQLLPYEQEMTGPLAALDATTLSRPSTIFLSLIVGPPTDTIGLGVQGILTQLGANSTTNAYAISADVALGLNKVCPLPVGYSFRYDTPTERYSAAKLIIALQDPSAHIT